MLAATILIAAAAVAAMFAFGRSHASSNVRHTVLLRSGSATADAVLRGATTSEGALAIDTSDKAQTFRWDIDSYEARGLVEHARTSQLAVWFVGVGATSDSENGSIDVFCGGTHITRLRFSTLHDGFFPPAFRRYVPANVLPTLLTIVPLDREYGFSFGIDPKTCRATDCSISIRANRVRWTISRVALHLSYEPQALPLAKSTTFTLAAALLVIVALSFAATFWLASLARISLPVAIAAAALIVFGAVTHDQWDFPLWIRFGEFFISAHSNPAAIWTASPGWAFIPIPFAVVTLASKLFLGSGSATLTAVLLKCCLGVAYCANAWFVAREAPATRRASYALAVLFSPLALYALVAGYREPLACCVVFCAALAARKGRLLTALFAFVVAASITETLVPLVMFPAVMALDEQSKPRTKRVAHALILALGACTALACEWLLLVPHEHARMSIAYRFGIARLGGGSWAGSLATLNLLPPSLPVNQFWFGIVVFVLAASIPGWRLVAILRDRTPSDDRLGTIFSYFTMFIGALIIGFRGQDPNMWYVFLLLTFYCVARRNADARFPIAFGAIGGLVFYADNGLGEFLGTTAFTPFDRGLFGILSRTRNVFALAVDGAILSAILATGKNGAQKLVSHHTWFFFAVFAAATAATAIRDYPADLALCAATVALVGISLYRDQNRGFQSPKLAGLDVVFVASALFVLYEQAGSGIVSQAGWITFILLVTVGSTLGVLRAAFAAMR